MGMNGPEPITPRDIREWCEMTGTILHREECEILVAMDAEYRHQWRIEADAHAAVRQERQKQQAASVRRTRR
jgi:hypothetical protein